jgi:hypothetical protein
VSSFRTLSERREFNDELTEREFDDEPVGREYDSELFKREPEPLFGFIKLVVQQEESVNAQLLFFFVPSLIFCEAISDLNCFFR